MKPDADLTCRQCGSAALQHLGRIPNGTLFAGRDLVPPWDGGDLYRCKTCELGFRHPVLTEAEYESLYEAASSTVWVSEGLREDQSRVRNHILASRPSGTVLDVGCYDGSLLASLGGAWRTFGLEASTAAAEAARGRGVTIVASKIRELAQVPRTFDAVCAIDVIEHVADPKSFLRNMAARVTPGGLIIVSTGSLDDPAWKLAGGSYWYCSIAEHISFISPPWARHVAGELGLVFEHSERFAYLQWEAGKLPEARRRYNVSARKAWRKRIVLSLMPGQTGRMAPRTVLGYPGLFEDHVVLVFRKPA